MKPRAFSEVEFGEELEFEPDIALEKIRSFTKVANMVAETSSPRSSKNSMR